MQNLGSGRPLALVDRRAERDSLKIRLAVASDLADVVMCEDLAFNLGSRATHGKNVSPHGELALQIAREDIHVLAAGARFVGYISFARKHDHLFVATLAVLPRFHRTGSGSRLLSHAEAAAARLGLGHVHLFTDGRSAGNLLFYCRQGYTETGRCEEGEFLRVYLCKAVSAVAEMAVARSLRHDTLSAA